MAFKTPEVDSGSGFADNWQSGKTLADCNLHMLTTEDSCDVSFRVGGQGKIIRAHRYVLVSRSYVFHAMLCGPLAEKNDVRIPDVEADMFEEFFKFLYTDKSYLTSENVTCLLYLARKYAVGGLERLCLRFLRASLSPSNACVILEQAHLFDDTKLYDESMKIILENGNKCFGDIQELCHKCLHKIVSSEALVARPRHVVNAALSWLTTKCEGQGREVTPTNLRAALGETLYVLPFMDMEHEHFISIVLNKQLLTREETVLIIQCMQDPKKDSSPFRRNSITPLWYCEPSKLAATDVIFFDQVRHVRGHTKAVMTDRLDFRCDRDILLCGVYIYKSKDPIGEKYTIRVQQYLKERDLENSLYPTSIAENDQTQYSTIVHLNEPVFIKAMIGYNVYIRRKGKGVPLVLGSERKSPTVKQCAFLQLPTGYIGGMNLIKGFRVKGLDWGP